MGTRVTLRDLLYRGRHREVVQRTVDSKTGRVRPEEFSTVVGALSFLGRLEEAEWILDGHREAPGEDVAEAAFFWGVGLCRHSRYDEARKVFGRSLRQFGRAESPRAQFFAFQGVSFYRYFCTRPKRAVYWAERAYRVAAQLGFLYGKFLSADLTGHCRLQSGDCSAGLKRLEEAGEYARLLGDGGVARANQVAVACYRSALGLETDLEGLEALLQQVEDQDTFTRSTLLLELGHQRNLRGHWKKATETLNEACRVIQGMGHRRHGILLKLRYAYASLLSGNCHHGLVLCSAARGEIDPQVDQPLELMALGLEQQIRSRLQLDPVEADLKRLTVLTAQTGLGRSQRHIRRSQHQPTLPPGEDPLGDGVDGLVLGGRKEWLPLLRQGYLGLVAPHLPGEGDRVVLGLTPQGLLLVGEDEGVWREKGVTDILIKVLIALEAGNRDKEELVREVWGYTYDPIRHDALVYSTMSRLRAALHPFGDWLVVSESGYGLVPQVAVHNLTPKSPAPRVGRGVSMEPSLNVRQGETLDWLTEQEWISVRDYQGRFTVSRVTASRDLGELARKKLVVRAGKGRATRYGLASHPLP